MMAHRVTIAEVAREAGVSLQTVSRAINKKGETSEETRQRVSEVIQRLGYRPKNLARGLVTHKTLTFGLAVPGIASRLFAEIAGGADDTAHTAGYGLGKPIGGGGNGSSWPAIVFQPELVVRTGA